MKSTCILKENAYSFSNLQLQENLHTVQEKKVATFDQRGQKVTYQYNANGDINFGTVLNPAEAVEHLRKLQDEVRGAVQANVIDTETAIDVEANLKKAVINAEKPQPDKSKIVQLLTEAKSLIEGITSAAGLVAGIAQAVEVVRKIF